MDLSKLDLTKSSNEGAWVELKHPTTEEKLPMKVKVIGKDSDKFIEMSEKYSRSNLDDLKANKTFEQRLEKSKEYADKLLINCTLEWDGIELDGKKLDCTPENVKLVYKRFNWIREQVDAAIADRANFL